jgi:nucleoside-diphosphate-sugar epimerase
MQNSESIETIIIGKRSNLSFNLAIRFNDAEVFSSAALLQSLLELSKFRDKKINIVFNNFQPSTLLNSFIDPQRYVDLSISLTIKVLMYLLENGALINRIIYTSSCSVYGDIERGSGYNQISPIGIPSSLKYLNEEVLREVSSNYGFDLTIARVFNIFAGNDEFSVVSKIYNCYVNKKKLNILNEGRSIRDYIHINNIVDVYEKLLFDSSVKIDTLDIGTGEGKSVAEILKYLSGKGFTIDTKSSTRKEVKVSRANTTKLKEVLDISSFVDVNLYLLDKLKNSK